MSKNEKNFFFLIFTLWGSPRGDKIFKLNFDCRGITSCLPSAMYPKPSTIRHQPSAILLALFILWWVHIKSLLVQKKNCNFLWIKARTYIAPHPAISVLQFCHQSMYFQCMNVVSCSFFLNFLRKKGFL